MERLAGSYCISAHMWCSRRLKQAKKLAFPKPQLWSEVYIHPSRLVWAFIHSTTSFDVCLRVTVLLKQTTVSNDWFEVKNLEILLHYSSNFVQCTSTTSSRAALEHDSWYSLLRFVSLVFTHYKHTSCHCGQKLTLWYVSPSNFSLEDLACPCEQLKISVELEDVNFWASSQFMVKLASLWKVTLVCLQFPTGFNLDRSWIVLKHPNHFPLIWGWQLGTSSRPWQTGDTSE